MGCSRLRDESLAGLHGGKQIRIYQRPLLRKECCDDDLANGNYVLMLVRVSVLGTKSFAYTVRPSHIMFTKSREAKNCCKAILNRNGVVQQIFFVFRTFEGLSVIPYTTRQCHLLKRHRYRS